MVEHYLIPYLGRIPLAELSYREVKRMFLALILKGGVVWTAKRVEAWRALGIRPRLAVWTVPQTAQFLDSIDWHRLYAAVHLMALRGLRRHRARQLHKLKELGAPDSGYVFTDTRALPIAAHHLSDVFRRLLKASGLPPVRLHDLRHGAASLALQAGADLKVVCDQLGHSSIVLTADTYVSVLPASAREAAEAIAELILAHGARVPGTNRTRRRSARPLHVSPPELGKHRIHPRALMNSRNADPDPREAWPHQGPTAAPPNKKDARPEG